MADIKAIVKKIREAIYGLDVRESIAQGMEGLAENEEAHKIETNNKINEYKTSTDNKIDTYKKETDVKITNQNTRIDELDTHYQDVIKTGGDSVLEIVDARVPFNTLKEKLNDIEEKSLNIKDISLGAVNEEENRTLKVFNADGDMVAIIDKDNTSFNHMEIANLTCANVLQKQDAITLYVNGTTGSDSNDGLTSGSPLKTIMGAVNSLQKYLDANIVINISDATYNENLYFDGFMGKGAIYLYCNQAVINGDIFINSCTTAIRFYGKDASNTATLNHTTTRSSAYTVYSSPYSYIQYFTINGNANTKTGVEANQGGGVAVKSCEINNTQTAAVVAYECSRVYAVGNKGSNNKQYSIYSVSGSTICIFNTKPDAPLDDWNTTGIIHGTATKTASSTSIQTPTVSSTKTYTTTKQISYRGVDGWSRSGVYQGKYNPSNGASYLHYGAYVLNTATMKTDLNGKLIQSVKLTVKRAAEGQGIGQPTAAELHIYGSTTTGSGSKPTLGTKYAVVKNVSKNQEITFTLPNAVITDILNSGVNSLVLYTSDGSSYLKMDSKFSLEVIYK